MLTLTGHAALGPAFSPVISSLIFLFLVRLHSHSARHSNRILPWEMSHCKVVPHSVTRA